LIRSALAASVEGCQPSDQVWEQIRRRCEAKSLLEDKPEHPLAHSNRVHPQLLRLGKLAAMLLLRGLGILGEILSTERVAVLGYRTEGSASAALASL
jgi:hypothetical protein